MNNNNSALDRSKGAVHIGIGIVYCIIAGMIIWAQRNQFIEIDTTTSYVMCGLFGVYGLFRIYRGYKRVRGHASGW